MDLLPQTHHPLRDVVYSFAEREIRPLAAQYEISGEVALGVVEKLAATGWFGLAIPKVYGGMGLGHLAKTVALEEVSRVSPAAGITLQAGQLGAAMILYYGSERLKQTWLPLIAAGTAIVTIASTEPGSGSHILGMEATAKRDGDHWILNGRKWFIANSHVAHAHGVVVRTGEGSGGLSAFLVEANRPGCRVGVEHALAGLRGFNMGEVIFEDCRVPTENMIGIEGQGLEAAHHAITLCGKPNLTAVSLGLHQAILEDTIAYARDRRLYGRPLAALSSACQRIADIHSKLFLSRLAAYDAVMRLDRGEAADEALIIAKLAANEGAIEAAQHAIALAGARGGLRDYPFERHLRDAMLLMAPGATSDVQRKRIAEIALGTYRGTTRGDDGAPRDEGQAIRSMELAGVL